MVFVFQSTLFAKATTLKEPVNLAIKATKSQEMLVSLPNKKTHTANKPTKPTFAKPVLMAFLSTLPNLANH